MGARWTMTRLDLAVFVLLFLVMGWGVAALLRGVGSSPEARNHQRRQDTQSIAEAIFLYALDHNGRYPEGVLGEARPVCRGGAPSCDGKLDLHSLIPRYLEHVPVDPFAADVEETFYTVSREGKRIVVTAPYAEGGETIRVER